MYTVTNPDLEWIPRYHIINYLIEKYRYTRYLEIGVNSGDNISKINAPHIDGVDPIKLHPMTNFEMTSDEFFSQLECSEKYDIIFIDGLHLHEQVILDVENSLKHLNAGGLVLLHDYNPVREIYQVREHIPGRPWNGDVWKAILHFRKTRKDLQMCTINTDYGIGVIAPGEQILYVDDTFTSVAEYSYKYFDENRLELLNLVSVNEFINCV
jgi:hypothetical protein